MNKTQNFSGPSVDSGEKDDLAFIHLLIFSAKYRKKLLWWPIASAVIAAGISLALPNIYRADAKLLPPQQSQSATAALLSQLGGMAGAAASAAGVKNPNDIYIGILKSRTVADRLIEKFDLKREYDTESQEKARRILAANTIINTGKDGLIMIDVEDQNQNLVADLANGYVIEIIKLTRELAVTEASQRRLFFERQLEAAKDNLAANEMTLKKTLDTRGVISVDSDSRAIIETVSRVRALISAKEIQLRSMTAFVTQNNPEYLRVSEELTSLRTQLAKLENGNLVNSEDRGGARKQETGLENIKLLRDVKYYQMLYELLAKQYEAARLDEAKDAVVIQVLDSAVKPEKKHKPRRAIIVLLASLGAFALAVVAAFLAELRSRLVETEAGAKKWTEFQSYLRPGTESAKG